MKATDLADPKAWLMAIAAVFGFAILSLPGVSWGAVILDVDVPDIVVCNNDRQPGRPPAGACDLDIGSANRAVLASEPVPSEWSGATCTAVAVSSNGPSTHPGTDFIISSANTVVAANVERASGVSTEARGDLILDGAVTVTVQLGPDGVFSGNGSVEIDCQPVVTTTQATTTTTQPSTTTTGATSTTAPSTATTITSTSTTVVPPVTTGPPESTDETLPFTGPEDHPAAMGGAALALTALGGLGLYATRSRNGRHEA